MGVPAFYRWLSEKYPKVVQDVLEERVALVPGSSSLRLPFDASRYPNPSGLECDNLYIDMNGIIHPCAHPEHGPQPRTEEEMYVNVCLAVDRLIRAIRPRQLLYLAIDGVAPRAKMNQQRSRRFRSAQEARELHELEQQIRVELQQNGQAVPPTKNNAWDSNVITPGTPFMIHLAEYIRFYIRQRLSTDKAWKNLRVLFSDASIPGEGEHKIMNHIRNQRSQPGYNPNLVHVLHGLDADLIMLGLATHEIHFYISREQVLFGRKSQEDMERRQLESGFRDAQRTYDEQVGDVAMTLPENIQTPLQRVSIPILREYLAAEFAVPCLSHQHLSFAPNLEQLIDDIVFLCFFVGNDFLPHLPSLDIRDGALDFLFNVYKRLLPSLGGYITKSGGNVNLSHVDVILAEVGAIEDYVFTMKHENEMAEQKRRQDMKKRNQQQHKKDPPPPPPMPVDPATTTQVQGRAARILAKQQQQQEAIALSRRTNAKTTSTTTTIQVSHQQPPAVVKRELQDNAAAAKALKESLGVGGGTMNSTTATTSTEQEEESANDSTMTTKKRPREELDSNGTTDVPLESNGDDVTNEKTKDVVRIKADPGIVGDAEEEFDADVDDDDEELDVELPVVDDIDEVVDPQAAARFKARVKAEQQNQLDQHVKTVEDKVRLHEAGWKDRYYSDKCKADDVRNHGGREHLFRSYVMGLCWVMKYYYDGCPSWKWYYPFHYGPFASDLKNIERFEQDCKSFELNTPFNPVEQLMAVLPSDSSHAIPKESRWLMLDPESPIIDFYPMDVPVDPNGKAMPWLWVVLLPFIDEDRLLAAMSPTMVKWEKDELFCNARGLDDGYLYIHRNHPLCKKFISLLQAGKTAANSPKVKLTDSAVYGCPGFSGSVRPPLSNELYPLDESTAVQPPTGAHKIDTDIPGSTMFVEQIDPNDAVCVAYTEPHKLAHKSILLPGAVLAPPVLTADDKRIRRPRLNRGGGSIAHMGGSTTSNGQSYKEGYGSMNISSYERNLALQNGRGNEMNQTGNRAWGAMEPVPKRHHGNNHGPQQQQQNQYRGGSAVSNHHHAPQQQHRQQQQHWQNQGPPMPPPQYQNQGHRGPQRPVHGYPNQNPSQYQQGYGQQQQGYQQPPQGHRPQNYPSGQLAHGQNNQYRQGPPPPPPHQQQGFDFRSFNQGPGYSQQQQQQQYRQQPPYGSQPPPPPANDSRRSRASADVMNNLRAQLTSTLNQKRGGGPHDRRPNHPR